MLKPKIPEPGFVPTGQILAEAHSLRWVVAMVWSGFHKRVARDLRDAGWTPYAPIGSRFSHRTVGRSSGLERRVRCVQHYPVFGAYMFVGHPIRLLGKSAHEKIVDVLGNELGPITISPEAIRLIAQADVEGEWEKTGPRGKASQEFEVDQEVRVKVGPFAGFIGLVRGMRGELRYQIEVSIFGRPTKATIEASQIEAV